MDQVKVKEELRRGLEAANQLRVLLAQSSQGKELTRNNQTLMACMRHQSSVILDTLDTSISILRNCHAHGGVRKRSYHNNRRNIQQRPVKTIDSTLITEDGYYWRKYGQKTIAKAKYPREYYRCGYKDQGCQATKYVQIISENPTKYNITYYGQHTCHFLLNNEHSHFHCLSDCLEKSFNSPNILSFDQFSNAEHGLNQVQQDHRVIQQQHTSPPLDHDHGCAMPLSPRDQSCSSIISDEMANDHMFSPPMLSVDYTKYYVMEDLYGDEFDGGVQDIQFWDGL